MSKVQEHYKKNDTDTFINELRDSICGGYLGFDCKNASDLLFICYGQHKGIGDYLKKKIADFNNQKSKRSTQTIALSKLIFDYDFKILTITKSKEELLQLLITKNSSFKKIKHEVIVSLREFNGV